ncbi:Hypothetical Protein FCC1311_053362 [Hondaea fermentalgiana]|uniref:Uncharacterized protein n=1 Tax=Hondaea fermentalgiana TaxID=2315210 RepID=A0A2R5GKG4_9STRA|nr:Hypothetical Protein FCC1311_053362 [Hondaea fermentalgiana]|eukprot:GBG29113.1 Hypothetical Protein FCC1311_053362 [Hondaea fermentalgiana]
MATASTTAPSNVDEEENGGDLEQQLEHGQIREIQGAQGARGGERNGLEDVDADAYDPDHDDGLDPAFSAEKNRNVRDEVAVEVKDIDNQVQQANAQQGTNENAEIEDFDDDIDATNGTSVKYYGPGGLVASEDGSVSLDSPGPGGKSKRRKRPEVPNRIVLLPVYLAKDLLEILCALLPGRADRLRDLYMVAPMPKSISVVHFIEELATRCQDLDQEEEIIQGRDSVDFWLELEDKLQGIGLKRLEPRRFTSVAFSVAPATGPDRSLTEAHQESEGEANATDPVQETSDGRKELETSQLHDSTASGSSGASLGPDGLPQLRLEIPADDYA